MAASENLLVLLPSASRNPYLVLLQEALERNGLSTKEANWPKPLVLPLTRSAILTDVNVVQLEWLYDFYMSDRFSNFDTVNHIITYCRAFVFIIDLIILNYSDVIVVHTVHNEQHHEQKYQYTERIINEIAFLTSNVIVTKCETASEIIKKSYRNASREKITVVKDGNYIRAYENSITQNEARNELNLPNSSFIYLYFGYIREYKGIPNLIDAFTDMAPTNAELWIVGKPKTDDIANLIRERAGSSEKIITKFEFIDMDNVQYYFNMANVLVLPYRNILNSGTVYLGLSFSLPIIAPRLGCIPESIPSENDFLYDPNDPNSLGNELSRAYENPKLDSIGEKNYNYARAQSWDKTGKQLKTIYKSQAQMLN